MLLSDSTTSTLYVRLVFICGKIFFRFYIAGVSDPPEVFAARVIIIYMPNDLNIHWDLAHRGASVSKLVKAPGRGCLGICIWINAIKFGYQGASVFELVRIKFVQIAYHLKGLRCSNNLDTVTQRNYISIIFSRVTGTFCRSKVSERS